jgi:hypothetical protein
MATALKLRRGTTAQHSTFTGAEGEITVDTTKETVVVHDGTTAGGFPLVTETRTQTLTNKTLASPSITGVSTFPASTGRKVSFYQGTEGYSVGVESANFKFVTDASAIFTWSNGSTYSTATEYMRLDTSGNLGIGTTTPSSFSSAADNLVVGTTSGDNGITVVTGTSNQGSLFFADGTTGGAQNAAGFIYYLHTSDYMALGTSNTERMRIDSSGNVGIGTASPAARLEPSISNPTRGIISQFTNSAGSSQTGAQITLNQVNVDTWTFGMPAGGSAFAVWNSRSPTADGTVQLSVNNLGALQFNSGYGSVATAYGCRAWVNFNGTGTVAIRASGNVSSITDNGTGNYTINFTNAMPDINYATTVNTQGSSTGSIVGEWGLYTSATNAFQAPTTSAFRITTWNSAVSALADTAYVMATVFR